MSEQAKTIDTLLDERRTFAPSAEFLANARVKDHSLWQAADADPEAFWAEQAGEAQLVRAWDTVLEWDLPFAKWFVGGKTQRRLQLRRPPRRGRQRATRSPIIWEGEPRRHAAPSPTPTCYREVCQASPTR